MITAISLLNGHQSQVFSFIYNIFPGNESWWIIQEYPKYEMCRILPKRGHHAMVTILHIALKFEGYSHTRDTLLISPGFAKCIQLFLTSVTQLIRTILPLFLLSLHTNQGPSRGCQSRKCSHQSLHQGHKKWRGKGTIDGDDIQCSPFYLPCQPIHTLPFTDMSCEVHWRNLLLLSTHAAINQIANNINLWVK